MKKKLLAVFVAFAMSMMLFGAVNVPADVEDCCVGVHALVEECTDDEVAARGGCCPGISHLIPTGGSFQSGCNVFGWSGFSCSSCGHVTVESEWFSHSVPCDVTGYIFVHDCGGCVTVISWCQRCPSSLSNRYWCSRCRP